MVTMETFIRERIRKQPEIQLTAASAQRLQREKALRASLQNLQEKEKKTYEAGLLQTEKSKFNTLVARPLFRRTFNDAKLTNQEVLTKALQAPASLAGLQMTKHLGLPGLPPIVQVPPPMQAPGMTPNDVREAVAEGMEAQRRMVQAQQKSSGRGKAQKRYKSSVGQGTLDKYPQIVRPVVRRFRPVKK